MRNIKSQFSDWSLIILCIISWLKLLLKRTFHFPSTFHSTSVLKLSWISFQLQLSPQNINNNNNNPSWSSFAWTTPFSEAFGATLWSAVRTNVGFWQPAGVKSHFTHLAVYWLILTLATRLEIAIACFFPFTRGSRSYRTWFFTVVN